MKEEKKFMKLIRVRVIVVSFALSFTLLATPAFASSATWLLNPGSGDWNTATNWTPVTVPNGPSDTATFDTSNTTAVSLSANTEALTVFFSPAASPFTITSNPGFTLTINSGGVDNISAFIQRFVTAVNGAGQFGQIHLVNSATAGINTRFTNNGATVAAVPGITNFYDTSSAGSATFFNNGGTAAMAGGGATQFLDTGTTAANGMFINNGATATGGFGGATNFVNGTAANGTFANYPGTVAGAGQGRTIFQNSATAANGMFTNNEASINGVVGGSTEFLDTSTAADSMIVSRGGTTAGAGGGLTLFSGNGANIFQSSFAGNATLIANSGTGGGDGGRIEFIFFSHGENARVEVFGNGNLDISFLFSGGTTIGSLEGDGNVFLGSNNLAIGTNNMDTTFSGVIQDGGLSPDAGGSISKVGTGMLTLTHDNTYTGGTSIEDGILAIGSLNAMGTGDVTVNGGTLQTFNGPRAMAVGGNYVQNTGGTLQLQIGGLNSGVESDFLAVNGSASLGGTLALVRINNFDPAPGDRVNIIGDLGGHTGMFDNVTSTFTGFLQPVPHYDEALDVYIRFEITSFTVLGGLTPNQKAVANELNEVRNNPRASDLISFLVTEPFGNLPHDFDLIAPEELASIYEMGFTQANMQGVNLMQRMDDIRAGSTGFCSTVAMEMPPNAYTKESDGKEVLNKNSAPAFVPAPENRWGIWATGSGQFVNVGDDDDNATGYNLSNGNFTVGIDYRLLHNLAFGIYGGYDAGVANLVNDGRITTNGGNVGGFATWFWDRFYVDVSGGGTWNDYKTRRAALLGDAIGSTKGSQYNVLGALGYDWRFGCLNIGPRATFQYTDVSIDHFGERGSLAPLDFPDQNENSLQSTVGVRASYDLHPSKTVIIRPELNVAWLHEYNDQAYPIDASLASGAGDVFTVRGPTVGRDGAQVRAGASAQLNRAFSVYVYYDGLLGRSNYNSNGVSGGFTWSF